MRDLRAIGVRKDLITTTLNQVCRLVLGPATMVVIPLYLTQEAQGYWYTIISLSALSAFADLGFTDIILQFAAHEFAHLGYEENGELRGDSCHLERLGTLLRFVLKWLIVATAAVFPLISIVGMLVLGKDGFSATWLLPWFIFIMGSAITFISSAILSFFEGCGRIARSQATRVQVNILYTVIVLSLLFFGFSLFALCAGMAAASIFQLWRLISAFRKPISQLLRISKGKTHSWSKEVLPLFVRYVVSFSCGYLIFQIYTPLMFIYHGAAAAGKVGISLTLWRAVFSVANIWIYIATPSLNMHVSRREWKNLDSLFFQRLLLSVCTFLLGSAAVFLVFVGMKGRLTILDKIMDRFMSLIPMAMLFVIWLGQLTINSIAVYLRAHKREPLVYLTMATAAWTVLGTLLSAQHLPMDFFFLGYLSSYGWSIIGCILIFSRLRRTWHGQRALSLDSNTNL